YTVQLLLFQPRKRHLSAINGDDAVPSSAATALKESGNVPVSAQQRPKERLLPDASVCHRRRETDGSPSPRRCQKRQISAGLDLRCDSASSVAAHYKCMLFASALPQLADPDDEVQPANSLAGFELTSLEREARRGQRLRCSHCRRCGATAGCQEPRCSRGYHLPCAKHAGALLIHAGSFASSLPSALATEASGNLQGAAYANSAGSHFIKCPLCANTEKFRDALLDQGIEIPCRDASWELDENAYASHRYRPRLCSHPDCPDPEVDHYGVWLLKICYVCGADARHVTCAGMKTGRHRYCCQTCTAAIGPAAGPSRSRRPHGGPSSASCGPPDQGDAVTAAGPDAKWRVAWWYTNAMSGRKRRILLNRAGETLDKRRNELIEFFAAIVNAPLPPLPNDLRLQPGHRCRQRRVSVDTFAPFLFVLVLDWVLWTALPSNDDDGFLLQRRVGRRQQERRLSVLGYANELAQLSSTVEVAQRQLDPLSAFVYHGGLVPDVRKDLRRRRGLAWTAFCSVRAVLQFEALLDRQRAALFQAVIETVLLYDAETWTLTDSLEQQVDAAPPSRSATSESPMWHSIAATACSVPPVAPSATLAGRPFHRSRVLLTANAAGEKTDWERLLKRRSRSLMAEPSTATWLADEHQQQLKYPVHRHVLFSGAGRDIGGGGRHGGDGFAPLEFSASGWDASEIGLLVIACLLLCTVALLTLLSLVFCRKRNTVFVADGAFPGEVGATVRRLERAKEQEMIELDSVLAGLDGCSDSASAEVEDFDSESGREDEEDDTRLISKAQRCARVRHDVASAQQSGVSHSRAGCHGVVARCRQRPVAMRLHQAGEAERCASAACQSRLLVLAIELPHPAPAQPLLLQLLRVELVAKHAAGGPDSCGTCRHSWRIQDGRDGPTLVDAVDTAAAAASAWPELATGKWCLRPRMNSYRFMSISSSTSTKLPDRLSYTISSSWTMNGWGLSRRMAWISLRAFTCSQLLYECFIFLQA
uniref:PHD-type domain-containing protein n=1 Tax=Macrostomum lignano TaxID=282301 RepID=A0A1I8JN88_9PLAT